MTKEEILKDVNKIFIKILDIDDLVINYDTAAKDIDEWDSLNHIQLIVAIEKHFKLKLKFDEVAEWQNVGEMCDSILIRLNKNEGRR